MKRLLRLLVFIVVVIRIIGWQIERFINQIDRTKELPEMSHQAHLFHRNNMVVDLHNDTLLLERNFTNRSNVGHIDIPRAEDGGVNLLTFAVATEVPQGANKDKTDHNRVDVLKLAYGARFSEMTLMSPMDRVKHQAGRFNALVAQSGGRMRQVLAKRDLEIVRSGQAMGGILGFEGAHAVGDKPENIDLLFDMGYRVAGLAHFQDNIYAGSAHGWNKYGLTTDGKKLVQRCVELGMIIDAAHLSPAGIDDLLAITDGPILVSHTGVRGKINNNRNITDAHAAEIAKRGGVIGVGFWDETCGDNSPEAIVDMIQYIVDQFGEDSVGLGSDFDGGITPAFDISQLPVITQVMMDRGMSEATMKKVLGENGLRLYQDVLPA